jgi:hypothetical protein
MFLALELCLAAICLALAYTRPPLGDEFFSPIERRFAAFSNRRTLAVTTVGALTLGIRLGLLPILPIPAPDIHDEFSHLLLADTLAHGRLANPTHPMWIHFETFHVNWHPVYASMYYPGHALFLAFGQVVFGNPFWGVLLSSALMCSAICWALQGWMPPKWALLGGLLAVIRLGTLSYWADSYWGGTTAALGGALVLGAFPRIKELPNIRDSVFFGLGIVLIALTRPYEGIFYCLPVGVALILWASRDTSPPLRVLLRRIALPTVLALAVGLGWLGYYFWRVTGSPFTTPYQVNMRTYGLVYFPWEKLRPVAPFHHRILELFYRGITHDLSFAHEHPLGLQGLKVLVIWLFYFGPLLTMPWFAWISTRRQGTCTVVRVKLRFLLLLCVLGYVPGMLTIYAGQPHYVAQLTATFYAATLLAMSELVGTPAGRWLVRSTFVLAILLFAIVAVADIFCAGPKPSWVRAWCTPGLQNFERARVLEELKRMPGGHLVIVRYRPGHDYHNDEWVFNGADIDSAKVIWARDMGDKNSELLNYFKARKAWLVEPDRRPVQLISYP